MASTNPDVEALLAAAAAAFNRNDLQGAVSLCQRAVDAESGNIPALATLGFLQHAAGRFVEAAQTYGRLVTLAPEDPDHWMNLGTARRGAGHFEEALSAYMEAARLGANSADFYFNVGMTHIDRKDYESGRVVLGKALELAPQDPELRYQYALCCYERVRNEDALAALDGWERLEPLSNELIANIGLLLMKLGDAHRAEPAVRRALAAAVNDPQPLLTLVQLLERTNRVTEALALMPQLRGHPQAQTLGSELTLMEAQLAQRGSDHAAAVDAYSRLRSECREPHLTHLIEFPLAKSLDALGRYPEAFETLQQAHASQVALLRMTAPALTARGAPTLLITRYGCDPEDIAGWRDPGAPAMADSPVFIVAFPRSGTTLLELTLDAHPQLVSMDEQPFVQKSLDDMQAAGASYPERLAGLRPAELTALRERYWARVRDKAQLGPGQRIVDKNPLNILRLPAIRRLFPHAPVILAVRHPFDVLLSCYMQHFRTPDFALLCSDLPALALGYRRTFDFWYQQAALLLPRSLELRYETLAADFSNEVQRILEFLQLPWDDAVLAPQDNAQRRGFISTPSYSQVIEPVNRKAVGRWRAYAENFRPVEPHVAPYLVRWGYEGCGSSNSR